MKTLLTLSLMLVGAASATTYPLTVTDDLGRKVTLNAEPQRIVSMLPSDTETICALGLCDKVVAVDKYSDYPAAVVKRQTVGDAFNPNVEAIVALKPDLVVVSKYGKLAEPLEKAGITVVAVHPETYDEVFTKTQLLGKILNREKQALNLVTQMKRDIAKVEILTKNAVKKPTVYLEVDPTPYSVGPKSFMGVLLTKAGGRNIITPEMGDFPKVDPEFIVKQNPQIILGLTMTDAKKRPGWNTLAAVKSNKVLVIPRELNTILGRPGPRIGVGLRGLAQLIHPELFK